MVEAMANPADCHGEGAFQPRARNHRILFRLKGASAKRGARTTDRTGSAGALRRLSTLKRDGGSVCLLVVAERAYLITYSSFWCRGEALLRRLEPGGHPLILRDAAKVRGRSFRSEGAKFSRTVDAMDRHLHGKPIYGAKGPRPWKKKNFPLEKKTYCAARPKAFDDRACRAPEIRREMEGRMMRPPLLLHPGFSPYPPSSVRFTPAAFSTRFLC